MKTRKMRGAAKGTDDAEQPSLFALTDDEASAAAVAAGSSAPEAVDTSDRRTSPRGLGTQNSPELPPGSIVPRGLREPLEAQFEHLPPAWRAHLRPFVDSAAYRPLCAFVDEQIANGKTVYPAEVFRALRLTSPDDVKVVIVGQDPYHGDDKGHPQAHGLAFSVPSPVRPPPSLRNIFKEIAAEFGHVMPAHGCLDAWARQGVLLLNTVLTVEQAKAASHAKRGWEACTDTLIRELAHRHEHLVFMLWGAHAQAKRALLDSRPHCVLEAPHPSPLSAHRGFLGCRHFMLANEYLVENGRAPIDWRLPETAEA